MNRQEIINSMKRAVLECFRCILKNDLESLENTLRAAYSVLKQEEGK